jgi:predicted Rossmann-fold nucleotide-binding protein
MGRGISRIVSGGQTGVDRAALDVAIRLAIDHGGWVPRGRRTEDGRLPTRYLMRETGTARYAERTRMNIEDSDGTLIICRGGLAGGTALTRALALRRGKPLLVVDVALFERKEAAQAIRAFIRENGISILNVAGPRESQCPGIYRAATVILTEAFSQSQSITQK